MAPGRFQTAVLRMEDTVAALTSEISRRGKTARPDCCWPDHLARWDMCEPTTKTITNLRSLMGQHVAVFSNHGSSSPNRGLPLPRVA